MWSRRGIRRFLVPTMLFVCGVSTSCSDLTNPLPRNHALRISPPLRDFGSCSPDGPHMPGGWCDDEWNAMMDAIDAITGDASCTLMRDFLLDWMWHQDQNGDPGPGIDKNPDMSPSVGATTVRRENLDFYNGRYGGTQMNPTAVSGDYNRDGLGLTLPQLLRHEYGHIFYNTHDDAYVDQNITNSCGLGGAHNGGGLGDPAPPVI